MHGGTTVRKIVRAGGTPPAPRAGCCPHCGAPSSVGDEPVVKRGAVIVAFDPVAVWWRGRHVPLSPVEALVFARIAQRGRLLNAEIEEYMEEIGASAGTRALVLGHIRRKFLNLGACDPIERLGTTGIRLRVDPDRWGGTKPVIGLRLPRYARAGASATGDPPALPREVSADLIEDGDLGQGRPAKLSSEDGRNGRRLPGQSA